MLHEVPSEDYESGRAKQTLRKVGNVATRITFMLGGMAGAYSAMKAGTFDSLPLGNTPISHREMLDVASLAIGTGGPMGGLVLAAGKKIFKNDQY